MQCIKWHNVNKVLLIKTKINLLFEINNKKTGEYIKMITLNELLERKRREYDDVRARLNELATDSVLVGKKLCDDERILQIHEKIEEILLEILILENTLELSIVEKNAENK